ncbi:MAG: hypothetical protein IKS54_10965 [Erysipelotrichaceae bacterium]|nr:hypothetical protein [Erysipelotrichaceae bacterium]
MKNRKITLFILSVLLLFLCACTSKDIMDEIPGVYYPVSCASDEGEIFEIEDEELHIEADGKGYFLFSGNMYELRWNYEDGKFTFEDSSDDVFTGTYKKGEISGKYFNDYNYVFKKKKGEK